MSGFESDRAAQAAFSCGTGCEPQATGWADNDTNITELLMN